jgi:hypothetical protein
MIYCDFDVLFPEERTILLEHVYHALKSGGLFIFDTLNDKAPVLINIPGKTWEITDTGFWKDEPYLALSENFHYEKNRVILQQHIVCTHSYKPEVYRFWTHYYNQDNLIGILQEQGYSGIEYYNKILSDDENRLNQMVTFCLAKKQWGCITDD